MDWAFSISSALVGSPVLMSSCVESRESLSLHFQFSACEPNCLPPVASSFNLKPCSKHIGDGQFGTIECSIVASLWGSRFLTCNQMFEVDCIFCFIAICCFRVDFKWKSDCIALCFSGDFVKSVGSPVTTTRDFLGHPSCYSLSFQRVGHVIQFRNNWL